MGTGWATRSAVVVAVVVAVFGTMVGPSLAADDAGALTISQALGQARLFAGLTDTERAALESAVTLRRCKEGERIIEQGKPLDRMFILLEGPAEVKVNGTLVATIPEQSLVGEIEYLDMLPASADVVIVKDARVLELNNAALTSLMKKEPRLGYVLMSEIARIEGQRLRAMDQK